MKETGKNDLEKIAFSSTVSVEFYSHKSLPFLREATPGGPVSSYIRAILKSNLTNK